MTDAERAELKRLAEAATPGPWSTTDYGPDHVEVLLPNGFSRVISDPTVITDYDARFIAAANPTAVLDLLATLDEATRLHERDHDERKALLTENERLKAELERIRPHHWHD